MKTAPCDSPIQAAWRAADAEFEAARASLDKAHEDGSDAALAAAQERFEKACLAHTKAWDAATSELRGVALSKFTR